APRPSPDRKCRARTLDRSSDRRSARWHHHDREPSHWWCAVLVAFRLSIARRFATKFTSTTRDSLSDHKMNVYRFGGRSFGNAVLRAFLVGTAITAAWLPAVAWYWKIVILGAAMFIVGLVIHGLDLYGERFKEPNDIH